MHQPGLSNIGRYTHRTQKETTFVKRIASFMLHRSKWNSEFKKTNNRPTYNLRLLDIHKNTSKIVDYISS